MIPRLSVVFLFGIAAACGDSRSAARPRQDESPAAGVSARPLRDDRPAILFIGTSLTAGLGLDPSFAYPAVIQRRLDSLGLPYQALNAGVSGETSAGALRRLYGLLAGPVRLVVVETGANDGLRGLDPDSTRANIVALIRRIREHDPRIAIALAGMRAPPNLGARFTDRFAALFGEVARAERVALIPFLLEGVGGVDSLNQDDGIHPTRAGQVVVADNVWRVIEPLLGTAR
jgi:acyl-CoA thioesterase-1